MDRIEKFQELALSMQLYLLKGMEPLEFVPSVFDQDKIVVRCLRCQEIAEHRDLFQRTSDCEWLSLVQDIEEFLANGKRQ